MGGSGWNPPPASSHFGSIGWVRTRFGFIVSLIDVLLPSPKTIQFFTFVVPYESSNAVFHFPPFKTSGCCWRVRAKIAATCAPNGWLFGVGRRRPYWAYRVTAPAMFLYP